MQLVTTNFAESSKWDRAGVIGSLVCITHCIATPLLAATLPVLAVMEKSTHIGLTIMLLLIGLFAFLPGYKHHNRPHMAVLAAIGFALLVLAAALPETIATDTLETSFTIAGGILLISAHLTNAYYCSRCGVCSSERCNLS